MFNREQNRTYGRRYYGNLNMKKESSKNDGKTFPKLVLAFIIYQLTLHFYFLLAAKDPKLLPPTLIAFLHDSILLAVLGGIFQLANAVIVRKYKNFPEKMFPGLIVVTGMLFALYPKLLREYLVFPVNIFESDFSSAETLLSDYLGLSAIMPSLIALVIGILIYNLPFQIIIQKKLKIVISVLSLIVLALTIQQPSPQPFLYSIQKSIESIASGKKRVVSSLNRDKGKPIIANKVKKLRYSGNENFNYNKILLIVLEGETAASFEEGFLSIKNGFYEEYKKHSAYFSNYYTTNLDSYTSLISMITAVQVPYRAYADESLFEKVNSAPSLTKDFRDRGFYNVFISCYEYQPFVPTRNFWDKIYERKDIREVDKWLTLGSSKMEKATEDKSAISTIIETIKNNERSFILHELVYGHSPEWIATTGKSQNEYHDEYLFDLTNKLKNENLWQNTLLVIVSDHGDRSKSAILENYRVPLLFIGEHINANHQIDSFLTHTELPQLIYHYALNDTLPPSREEIYLIGSTEKWVYGKALGNKESVFIDDARGIVLFRKGSLKATNVQAEFQEYLDSFNHQYGK